MSNSRRRILLTMACALVGASVGIAGTGHAYLRRWKRSLLWLVVTIGASMLLIAQYMDETAFLGVDPLDLATYPPIPPEVSLPMFIILCVSVFDALLIAYLDERERSSAPPVESSGDGQAEGYPCPNCGRSTDPELAFCIWCTESLPQSDSQAETNQ